MNSRALFLSTIAFGLCSACSVEDEAAAGEPSAGAQQQARVKDRVLEVVCDPDSPNRPEELVPLVREVRARDGRSDRVWEVADEADCIAGLREVQTTPAD